MSDVFSRALALSDPSNRPLRSTASTTSTTRSVAAIGAVLIRSRDTLREVWLVADSTILTEHPDIAGSGFSVVFFDEVERLRSASGAELATILAVKAVFPTSIILEVGRATELEAA